MEINFRFMYRRDASASLRRIEFNCMPDCPAVGRGKTCKWGSMWVVNGISKGTFKLFLENALRKFGVSRSACAAGWSRTDESSGSESNQYLMRCAKRLQPGRNPSDWERWGGNYETWGRFQGILRCSSTASLLDARRASCAAGDGTGGGSDGDRDRKSVV